MQELISGDATQLYGWNTPRSDDVHGMTPRVACKKRMEDDIGRRGNPRLMQREKIYPKPPGRLVVDDTHQ